MAQWFSVSLSLSFCLPLSLSFSILSDHHFPSIYFFLSPLSLLYLSLFLLPVPPLGVSMQPTPGTSVVFCSLQSLTRHLPHPTRLCQYPINVPYVVSMGVVDDVCVAVCIGICVGVKAFVNFIHVEVSPGRFLLVWSGGSHSYPVHVPASSQPLILTYERTNEIAELRAPVGGIKVPLVSPLRTS